jgi:hypothetical protein
MSLFMKGPKISGNRTQRSNSHGTLMQSGHTKYFASESRLLASDSAKLARTKFRTKRHTGDPAMLIVLFVATFAFLSLAFVPSLTLDD